MKDTLKPGLSFEFKYTVPENKTVPFLFPEAPEFLVMPNVLATGFMVGLFEWACIKLLTAHLDWPDEQSVGTGFTLNHLAATPPGLTVNVTGKAGERGRQEAGLSPLRRMTALIKYPRPPTSGL